MRIYFIFGSWSSIILFILLHKLFQFLPRGAFSISSYVPLTYPDYCEGLDFLLWFFVFFFNTFPYFLVLQDTPGSSCIYPAPVLESPISSFRLLENHVRTKIRVLGVLLATEVTMLPVPSADTARIYMCAYRPMYIIIFIIISTLTIYTYIRLNMSS